MNLSARTICNKLTHAGMCIPLLSVTLTLVAWSPRAVSQVSQWVDMEISSGKLLVASEIAGISGHSLIDTGAELNGINERFLVANNLSFPKGRKLDIVGAFGKDEKNVFQAVPGTIFGTDLTFNDVVEINIGPPEIQLIIGAGFLKLLVFQFDYPNSRMRAISRDAINLKELANIQSRKGDYGSSPIVKVRLNDDKDVWLLMDTGFNGGVLLDRTIARKEGWLEKYPSIESITRGINETREMQKFNLPSMNIAGFIVENPIISVPAEGQRVDRFRSGRSGSQRVQIRHRPIDGVLGYDVLRHFIVSIDYKSGDVHLEVGGS